MRYVCALIISLSFAILISCEKHNPSIATQNELPIPSDPKAKYTILEKSGNSDKPILITKRSGPSGESYAKRIFDCKNGTTKYLADSQTLEGLGTSKPEKKMYKIVKDSIAWYLYRHVCSEVKEIKGTDISGPALKPHERVAQDAMEKALIATEAKDYTSACTYMELATAVFLEAKDTTNYKKIVKIKKNVCENEID